MQRLAAPPRSAQAHISKPSVAPDWVMAGLLAFAFLVRVAAILAFPSLDHADENFQVFEQAHRFAFGYGIKPWEFVAGIRSPVLPAVFAAVFRVSAPLVGGPEGYLIVARLMLAAASLVAVAAVYRAGRRMSFAHGLIGGLVTAIWFELVYFAGRPLTEAVATTVFLLALSLASVSPIDLTFRRLIAIGLSLGLCLMLRVHLLFGLLVIALWVGRLQLRARWWPMVLGALIPIAVFGVADWIAWGGFFHSYVEAVRMNLGQGLASDWGTEPPGWYAQRLFEEWRYALPLIAIFVVVRARASAMWILAALAIVAVHSAIPHKEYRFVFPATACLVTVAAFGSADLLEWARRLVRPAVFRVLVLAMALLWLEMSTALAFWAPFKYEWFKGRQLIMASFAVAQKADLCGLLFYDDPWFKTGGYAYLHRNVALYSREADETIEPEKASASFNAVVLNRSSAPAFAKSFRIQQCFAAPGSEDVCLMVRDGTCTQSKEMNAFLPPGVSLSDAAEPGRSSR
jgi:GPI mannosyltransferase 3